MTEFLDRSGETPSGPWLGLLDGLVEDVLGLIATVWEDLADTAATLTEPDITLAVWRRLLPVLADRPYAVAIDDPGEVDLALIRGMGKAAKKIDLVIRLYQDPLRSYPIEAKVLVGARLGNYDPNRQAKAYVCGGVARFVTGAYRARAGRAAMLGYVLRGPESKCAKLVNDQLVATATPTTKELSKQGRRRYVSSHPRQESDVSIDHLWLSASA